MTLPKEAQDFLTLYAGGEHFQFESHGASVECLAEDAEKMLGILDQFDFDKSQERNTEVALLLDTFEQVEDGEFVGDLFQQFYELLDELEADINAHVPEGLWFGSVDYLYGFWEVEE